MAAVDGANASVGSIGVRDVRLAPTTDNAYKSGSTIPLKLWVSNTALTSDTLTGVSSPAADKIDIAGKKELAAQTLVEVTDSTDLKITLNGLKNELPYGHSIPVTFTFASAGTLTVNVPIEIPPLRETEGRETINVLPGEEGNIWFGGEHADESASADTAETSSGG